ncbi:hypothetical protein DOTSEDRAFT_24031 [Dothistroma septosporum NZE10]|uniref:AB hydrolase-1 domain-containing protein n=1 Tax=Dothistroma septosporum (strain NZE10 / CBS 128990) TaxID=675120 RepID=N1PNB7_DOTSN|nr:hypothetical protein DOTSEDRAFT_24031 [Dothistroma septosporum NZE10]
MIGWSLWMLLAARDAAAAISKGATHPLAGCRGVSFNVSGSAMNRDLSDLDMSDLDALMGRLNSDNFTQISVSGDQQLAGWYCPPVVSHGNNDKLQILLPAITTNRELWTGLGGTDLQPVEGSYQPQTYSWVQYMIGKGYTVLAMDNLGTGESSKPDPTKDVQAPYEVELYHSLATQLRSGGSKLGKSFKHLILVGNSYGSELGTLLAKRHPQDFDEMILTGFSKSVLGSLKGVAALDAMPAQKVDPSRFRDLDPGYLTSPNETTRTYSFFGDPKYVDFDPEVARRFFTRKDVVSVGQFISAYINPVSAPGYRGRVMVVTGEQDQAFCGPGSSAFNPDPRCGHLLRGTGKLFPQAEYNWKSIPKSGHALILQGSAPETLKTAERFLAGDRFGS